MTSVHTPRTGGTGREHDDSRPQVSARIEPMLVRVSVLGGNTQLDVALPAAIPVAALIGELVAHIESRSPARRDPDDPESDPSARPGERPHDRQHRWTLALVGGGAPIPPNRSLTDAGIRDGDLLLLQSVRTGEAPVLFDDVVDAIARLNESHFLAWTPRAARHLAFAATLLASTTAAVSISTARAVGAGQWVALLGGAAALGFLAAAVIVARHYRDATTATVLSAAAMPPVFAGGLLAVPDGFGAPHLGVGCALVLLAATGFYRVTAVGPITHSAFTSAALLGGSACLAIMFTDLPVPKVAATTAAGGLLIICLAPRATILLAKLPLPPVPTAGAPLDHLNPDRDAIEPAPTIEGIGAIGAIALPNADALELRARLANSYLCGIIAGVTAVTAAAAVLAAVLPSAATTSAATPSGGSTGALLSEFDVKPVVFAAIIGAALCLRGRSHSDLTQAVTLIIGGTLIFAATTIGLAFGARQWPFIGFGLAIVMAILALSVGVIAPGHDFSPLMRRAAEIIEYILLASVIPLLLWILDLYQTVREL
ncbi:MAG: type VII secretion integral membrane protein EccD [Gordonia sp. (in: high G+C Gram-positive bacteria)]